MPLISYPISTSLSHVQTLMIRGLQKTNFCIKTIYIRYITAYVYMFYSPPLIQVTNQSNPSNNPEPFSAEVSCIDHWRFLISDNPNASDTYIIHQSIEWTVKQIQIKSLQKRDLHCVHSKLLWNLVYWQRLIKSHLLIPLLLTWPLILVSRCSIDQYHKNPRRK